MKWYQLDVKGTLSKLNAGEQGLNSSEASRRLSEYGPNSLPEEARISKLKILIHQFANPLIYILMAAAVVTTVLKDYIDTGVIAGVLVLNAIIGFIQEFRAETSVRALRAMTVTKARVLRDGIEKEIDSRGLVPGDVVMLASGDKVPAEMRLFGVNELNIEEAMLTGESLPVEKTIKPIAEDDLTYGDQTNIAFMGTMVVRGRGKGVVVGTGLKTALGRIAKDVKELSITKNPLQEKIERFAHFIGALSIGGAAVIFALGMALGFKAAEMFKTAVAVTVATVPEGLPIVVTVTMAIGLNRMARRNAIIRKLHAVETLGSTTVICSDKTGTLTKNEMTVRLIHDGRKAYEVEGTGYETGGNILHEGNRADISELKDLQDVLRIGLLCNESEIYEEEGRFKVKGDPTEGALIVSAMKAGLDPEKERDAYPQVSVIPFESDRGYMATLHSHGSKKLIFIKGTPENVVGMCTECMLEGELRKKEILKASEAFASEGMRVLAMGYKEAPAGSEALTHDDIKEGVKFAGLQGMIDPPRPESIEAIKGCKAAGIRVVMITGDHAVTAGAIGRQIGITGDDAKVITGKELAVMGDGELYERVADVSIFARVAPEHKLRIVQQLMKRGEIVAVTGDGVNDAPALKAAHIGVAMGRSGTDVAKEAADMVVVDDNFASIFSAVEEGRIVFDNLRKVVVFLIPTGFAALISIGISMILGLPAPYLPAQLLWINLVTNGLQDVALGFEPGEKDIIRRRPRPPKEGIMSRLMLERSVLVGALISAGVVFNYLAAIKDGGDIANARTTAVTTMVFFQFFQAWNSRSETISVFKIPLLSNPFLFYSMIASFFAQLTFIYVPAMQWVFKTVPLTAAEWGRIALVSLSVIVVVELDKAVRSRLSRAR
ncbi:MAG: HAD-IC family P-type ATPase [Candidatus Omnitrophica bacterium]|nr:HAD-IC family P-type ATPase [Candidatus Omnitrophota bacterium]MDD5737169.1 HAD-IC family P-type ATPase [Candidatus Omnitrophota bacterium]